MTVTLELDIDTVSIGIINESIQKKDINMILPICKKAIGKSSIGWFYKEYGSSEKGYLYFLISNDVVVYIGASSDPRRVGQHQKTKEYDCFYYLPLDNYEHWHLETLLIRTFKTKYNCCNVSKNPN